jgi:hypothetical protein
MCGIGVVVPGFEVECPALGGRRGKGGEKGGERGILVQGLYPGSGPEAGVGIGNIPEVHENSCTPVIRQAPNRPHGYPAFVGAGAGGLLVGECPTGVAVPAGRGVRSRMYWYLPYGWWRGEIHHIDTTRERAWHGNGHGKTRMVI